MDTAVSQLLTCSLRAADNGRNYGDVRNERQHV